MPELRASFKGLFIFLSLMVLVALACNAPVGREEESASPTATSSATDPVLPSDTPSAPETVSSGSKSNTPTKSVDEPLPTFTSIQPTLAVTLKPTNTPTTKPIPSEPVTASATPNDDTRPLTFSYEITWRLNSPSQAIANVNIFANGGGGDYKYYRDDLPVEGSAFEYSWSACRGNPGSLRVDSADGQSVRQNYFEQPPCPTSTPES